MLQVSILPALTKARTNADKEQLRQRSVTRVQANALGVRVISDCCRRKFDYCVTRTAGVIAKSPGVRSAMSCANRLKMALVLSAPSLGAQ